MNGQSFTSTQFTLSNVVMIVGSIAAVSIVLRYIGRIFASKSDARPRTRFLFRAVESVLRIVLWFSVLTFALRLVAPSQNTLLLAVGSAAFAVALAARDLIRNWIGGLVIIAERPYEVGDRVTMAGTSGEIQHIGLRATRITTSDGGIMTIPNSKVLDGVAQKDNTVNRESMVVTDVILPVFVDPELALRVGREVLITSPYLCLRRPTAVTIVEGLSQAPYSTLQLNGYVYDHRFGSQMRTDLVCRCRAEFSRLSVGQHQLS